MDYVFNLFVSNNVSIGTPATNTHTRVMAGYNGTITLAEQLLEVEAFKPEASFGDAVNNNRPSIAVMLYRKLLKFGETLVKKLIGNPEPSLQLLVA